ncbi:hypothetical protein [Actinomadura sp. NPDC000929]|uniref:hypothetical protein n=1 Tax=Actinomadura sp. NPDC000929 TaxID=3154517 RepID=UPI003391D870
MTAPRAVPQPEEAHDPADLLDLMRHLQQWSGLPLSELEERMNADGVVVPSGLDALLSGHTLPSRGLVTSFVATCGLVPDERKRWLRVYDRLCGPAVMEGDRRGAEGDRRVAGRPALNLGPAAPPPPTPAPRPAPAPAPAPVMASAPPSGSGSSGSRSSGSGTSGRHAATPPGPRHRKKSSRGQADRRPVSLMVAAPAIITLGVVVTTLAGVFGGGGGGKPHRPQASPGASAKSAAPPAGWYTIMPITGERTGDCLSILPDEELLPQLAQDKCVADDRLQRIRLASVPGSAGTFQLKAWTPKGKLWCATLDEKTERATLHMRECGDDDPLQRFGLTPAGKPVKGGQLFDIVPEATRDHRMCMGVDIRISGGLETILASCGNTGVRGYLFTPASEP